MRKSPGSTQVRPGGGGGGGGAAGTGAGTIAVQADVSTSINKEGVK